LVSKACWLMVSNDPTTEYPIQEPGRREHNGD
jgi:hypothetical protein